MPVINGTNDGGVWTEFVQVPRELAAYEIDVTLGAAGEFTPPEYHEALDKLEKWFFRRCPDRLSKVDMVIDRFKEKKWEPVSATYVKFLD
jgi:hypothetical protein